MRIITHPQKIYKRKTVRFPQFFELFRFSFVHFLVKSVLQPINRRYFCIFFKKPYSFLIHFHGSEKRRTGSSGRSSEAESASGRSRLIRHFQNKPAAGFGVLHLVRRQARLRNTEHEKTAAEIRGAQEIAHYFESWFTSVCCCPRLTSLSFSSTFSRTARSCSAQAIR